MQNATLLSILRVCVCFCTINKKYVKFEYAVVYENNSEKSDNGHCRIKVKVTVNVSAFLSRCKLPCHITNF